MTETLAVLRADGRAFWRTRWVQLLPLAGIVISLLVALNASGDTGRDRQDALQAGGASLLLLGGLTVALLLGGTAFARDARAGYLGLMVAAGATPSQVGLGRLLVRALTLVATVALWGAALQAASLALGFGPDGDLAVHTLLMLINLALVMCATAAMASVIGPFAAAVFGLMVFVSAQAAVNLKAALEQNAIDQDSSSVIDPLYFAFPRALVSPMLEDLQRRDAGGPAAPQLEVNGLDVIVPASTGVTIAWTLLWTFVLASLVVVGVRRRQL